MTISILGCGWFGLPFGQRLVTLGYTVKGSTTSKDKLSLLHKSGITPFLLNLSPAAFGEIDKTFFDCDILLIAIPPKLRSSSQADYLDGIGKAIHYINEHSVRNVMFVSSTSVFGDENRNVNENDTTTPDTDSGKVLVIAEQLLRAQTNFTTTVVRFAGLIGPGRNPGRFFAGKTNIPNGRAPVNLIHLDDCCGVCVTIIQSMVLGHVIHACSPHHPQKQEYYTRASKQSGLPEPQFVDELMHWKIIETTNSDKLLSYQYRIHIANFNVE
ncbi:MAG: SDR family oxidoreductase [Chryseolinea sp.]